MLIIIQWNNIVIYLCMTSCKSCLTLCDPVDYSPPVSSVHGVRQARILEWFPCLPPGDPPDPGIELASFKSPALVGGFFTTSVTWEVHYIFRMLYIIPMVTIKRISRISLMIQWLWFHTSTAGVIGLTPIRELESHMLHGTAKTKEYKKGIKMCNYLKKSNTIKGRQ